MNLRLPSLFVAFSITAAVVAVGACSSEASPSDTNDGGGTSSGGGGDGGGGGGGDGGGGGGGDGGGGGGGDGGGGGNCNDTAKTVCDDFDQGTTIGAQWSQQANGGAVAIVAGGLSAPNALQVTVNAGGGTVYLEKEFPFTTKVHCELDMKIDALPTQGDLDLLSVTTKLSSDYYVYFASSPQGFQFAEFCDQLPGGQNVNKKQPIAAPPVGTWFHVVLDNDGANATLTVNGASATLTGLAQPNGPNRNIQLGTPFSQDTNSQAKMLYDNVVCTFGN